MPHSQLVGALIFSSCRVLLGFRTASRAEYPAVWDMIGGHVEPGERRSAALRRELQEKLGVDIGDRLASWRTIRSDDLAIELAIFLVTSWHGCIQNLAPDEHSELRWIRRSDVAGLEYPHPAYPRLIGEAFDAVAGSTALPS